MMFSVWSTAILWRSVGRYSHRHGRLRTFAAFDWQQTVELQVAVATYAWSAGGACGAGGAGGAGVVAA